MIIRIPNKVIRALKNYYVRYIMPGGGSFRARGADAQKSARGSGAGGSGSGRPAAAILPIGARNDRRNQKLYFDQDGYLTDQAAGVEGKYRYGITKTADTGCEIIAVYNLLLYAGKKRNLRKLIREFDSARGGRVLFGVFGTSVHGMQKVLQQEGVPVRCLPGEQVEEMDLAEAGILSFWWSESSFHIHSVMIEKDPKGGRITAYNFDPWHGIYQLSDSSVSSLIRHRGIRPIAFLEPING